MTIEINLADCLVEDTDTDDSMHISIEADPTGDGSVNLRIRSEGLTNVGLAVFLMMAADVIAEDMEQEELDELMAYFLGDDDE